MRNSSYQKRLFKDLDQWIAKGWVKTDHAEQIKQSLPKPSSYARLPVILGFLGAILICFAAMSFVAANWQDIPRFIRLIVLISALWGAYGIALWLYNNNHAYFAEAAILCALGLFGANIMLIAQMYHIDRSPANGVLLWTVGALATAGLARSLAALLASFVLMCVWSATVAGLSSQLLQWQFLVLWAVGLILTWRIASRVNIHFLIASLAFWIGVNLFKVSDRLDWHELAAPLLIMELSLCIFAAVPLLNLFPATRTNNGVTIASYCLLIFLIFVFLLQIFGHDNFEFNAAVSTILFALIVIQAIAVIATVSSQARTIFDGAVIMATAVIPVMFAASSSNATSSAAGLAVDWGLALGILLLCVWAVNWAQKNHVPAINTGALILFGVEVLYIYFETLGGLLNSSLFFMMGGLIFIALAYGLHRVHQHLTRAENASEVKP